LLKRVQLKIFAVVDVVIVAVVVQCVVVVVVVVNNPSHKMYIFGRMSTSKERCFAVVVVVAVE